MDILLSRILPCVGVNWNWLIISALLRTRKIYFSGQAPHTFILWNHTILEQYLALNSSRIQQVIRLHTVPSHYSWVSWPTRPLPQMNSPLRWTLRKQILGNRLQWSVRLDEVRKTSDLHSQTSSWRFCRYVDRRDSCYTRVFLPRLWTSLFCPRHKPSSK